MPVNNTDPFNVQGLDPNILAVPPDDPFSLLAPGQQIRKGDIKRLVGTDERWAVVTTEEIGQSVPDRGIAYARVCPPELYAAAPDDHIVLDRDLVWSDANPAWDPAGDVLVGQNVADVVGTALSRNMRLFVATLINPHDIRVVEVPAHHRAVYPGEKLRRGDKVIQKGTNQWVEVDESVSGDTCPGGDAAARYCRPTHARAMTWFVDEGAAHNGLGGAEDPFSSLEIACDTIEAAARATGQAPHGIIYSKQGVPLMCYDLPEPPPRGLPTVQVIEPQAPARQAEIPDERRSQPGDANSLAEYWGLTKQEAIDSAFEDCNSRYRPMHAGEETKAADLWYGPFNEDFESIMWQPCPPELQGLDPGTNDYIFARKQAPTNPSSLLESRLAAVEAALEAALADVRSLREELRNGS